MKIIFIFTILVVLYVFYQSTKYICYPEHRIISDKEYLESFVDGMLKSGNIKLHGLDNTVESYLAAHPKCCRVSSNAFWNNIEFSEDVVVSMSYEMSEKEKARGGYSNTHHEYIAFLDSCGTEVRYTGETFTPNPTTTLNH